MVRFGEIRFTVPDDLNRSSIPPIRQSYQCLTSRIRVGVGHARYVPNELTRQTDSHPHSILVAEVVEAALEDASKMERDPIGGVGRPEFVGAGAKLIAQLEQLRCEPLAD